MKRLYDTVSNDADIDRETAECNATQLEYSALQPKG